MFQIFAGLLNVYGYLLVDLLHLVLIPLSSMLAASFPSFDTMGMIPPQHPQMDNTAQVAEKVMRRIEIAKVCLF